MADISLVTTAPEGERIIRSLERIARCSGNRAHTVTRAETPDVTKALVQSQSKTRSTSDMSDVSRRKFLLSTGAVATGAAAVAAPKLIETLGSGADQAPVVNPSHPAPSEP